MDKPYLLNDDNAAAHASHETNKKKWKTETMFPASNGLYSHIT